MNYIEKFSKQFHNHLVGLLLINNLIIILDWWVIEQLLKLTGYWALGAFIIVPVLSMTILPWLSTRYLVQPTKLIWQAILHIAPDTANTEAPDLKQNHLGTDLVTYLVSHVYQLASVAENVEKLSSVTAHSDLSANFVANNIPLPMLVLSSDNTVLFANENMLSYLMKAKNEVIGQNVYPSLDMSFSSQHTFDEWLQSAKAYKATDSQSWERVRMKLADGKTLRIFDLAAYYNKNNPQGFTTIVVIFDHTTQYSQDDQAMSFVALAVHELRTPITLLRGYIEVFEEELATTTNPELADYMKKMRAASQQLETFVDNILNVARIENNQLVLKLQEENWKDILQAAVSEMQLMANVRGIQLNLSIDDDLPTVAVDRVSIYEVISNLIDNAIKYSGTGKKIDIHSYLNSDNLVETTVKDYGVGIPEASITNLFQKFYRNHRSRSQIGGTGLGLYLSKTIMDAHSGHIWVRSKANQGSVFGFSLQPYSQVASEQKNQDNNDIVRNAHGWIKNHSLYRN
jgi:signal transduction histidine kinase